MEGQNPRGELHLDRNALKSRAIIITTSIITTRSLQREPMHCIACEVCLRYRLSDLSDPSGGVWGQFIAGGLEDDSPPDGLIIKTLAVVHSYGVI